jgi:subfamily B ATP-binding cassette protein HlyB/CyaB
MTIAAIDPAAGSQETETGAGALAFILQLLGLPADAEKIRHAHGSATPLGEADLLRAARKFPVKARAIGSHWDRLARTPFPALAQFADGSWLVLGRVGDG